MTFLENKGDTWQMMLGDNPTGHGFVVWDLVLIELSWHPPASSLGEKGVGLKISEKILLGGRVRNFNFGGGGGGGGGGSHNFEVKIKTA